MELENYIEGRKDVSTYICKICNKEMTKKGFGGHISYKHKLTAKEYYDTYLKKPEEGVCPICGKETQFQRIFAGYAKYCCTSCAKQDSNVQSKYMSTMKEKYGYEHALQVPEIHSNLLNTLKEKAGFSPNYFSKSIEAYKFDAIYITD